MLASTTEVQGWLRCRRKRLITSLAAGQMGLTPVWPAKHFVLGSLVHQSGADWILDPKANLTDIFMSHATSHLQTTIQAFTQHTNSMPSSKQLDEYWETVNLGKAMCTNHQDYYKTPLPPNFTLVQPEQSLITPVPGTEHCECIQDPDSLDYCHCPACTYDKPNDTCATQPSRCVGYGCKLALHSIESTLDAIIADVADRFFVFERKTYGQRPNTKYLERDFQFLIYSWVLKQTGANTAGIAYDGWWKRYGNEPSFTQKSPKYTKSDLFFRYFMIRNPDELAEHQLYLAAILNEMADPNTVPYKTVPWSGCKDCLDLMPLCDAMSYNETLPLSQYMKRDRTLPFQDYYGED